MSEDLKGHYAGFVSRLIAYVMDAVLLSFGLAAMVWFINTVRSVLANQSLISIPVLSSTGNLVLAGGLTTVMIALYYAFFWSAAGRTPGKAFLGLRVVTIDGARPSFGRALVRVFGYALSALLLYLGYAMVLVDNRRQGLHDKLAGTYVIYSWEARHGGKHLTQALERVRPGAGDIDAQLEN